MIRTASILVFLLVAALFLEVAGLNVWKIDVPNYRYVTALVIANLLFVTPQRISVTTRIYWGVFLGWASLAILAPPSISLILLVAPSLALSILRAIPNGLSRVALATLFTAVLYLLRLDPNANLLTVFMVSFWLKYVSLALTERARLPGGMDGHLRVAFYFFAPPFLLGPLPLEWIRFAYFESRLNNPAVNDRRACRFMAHGLLFLLLTGGVAGHLSEWLAHTFAIFDESTPWWQQAVWGYSLFISRLLTLGGLTALSVGLFQLVHVELKYDFNYPILARDFLDFWGRYHSYAKDFLYAHIYLPIYFALPKLVPHTPRVLFSLAIVFLMVALVQHMNYVPAEFATSADFYGIRASLQHASVSYFLLIWTSIIRNGLRRFFDPKSCVVDCISWVHTQVAVGYFFFGAYWNLWKGLPLDRYFLRIFL